MSTELAALVGESYERAYTDMVRRVQGHIICRDVLAQSRRQLCIAPAWDLSQLQCGACGFSLCVWHAARPHVPVYLVFHLHHTLPL
jgi:hypothetical protein